MKCWSCRSPLEDYNRHDSCPKCRRDTRVCKNCDFYDEKLNNFCREPQADRVVDKEKSNFCDFFKPSTRDPGDSTNPQDKARAMAEALFKK